MQASRTPLGEYLRARRALISPEDVGFPVASRRRRVAGSDGTRSLNSQTSAPATTYGWSRGMTAGPTAGAASAQPRPSARRVGVRVHDEARPDPNGRAAPAEEGAARLADANEHPRAVLSVEAHAGLPHGREPGRPDVERPGPSHGAGRARARSQLPLLVFSEGWRAADPHWRTRRFAPPPHFDTVPTRPTRACTRSSASCTCRTRTSVVCGRGTMLGPTTWDRSTKTSPPSAQSVSPVRHSSCPAPRATSSWCSTPSRHRRRSGDRLPSRTCHRQSPAADSIRMRSVA